MADYHKNEGKGNENPDGRNFKGHGNKNVDYDQGSNHYKCRIQRIVPSKIDKKSRKQDQVAGFGEKEEIRLLIEI